MSEAIPRVELERRAAEEIWLLYFNNYLFEHNVITEIERNRMVTKITARKSLDSEPPTMRDLRKNNF